MDEKEIPSYVLEGWVARDLLVAGSPTRLLHFHFKEPHEVRADAYWSDEQGVSYNHFYNRYWTSDGETITLPSTLFPRLLYRHGPMKVRIKIYKADEDEE